MDDFNQGLLNFIGRSPTPFHAVYQMARQLEQAGFQRLFEGDAWQLSHGRYYVTRNDSSIIAFTLPASDLTKTGLAMVGAHTDSPCLKVKPNPEINKLGYLQIGVEVYGGVLLNPWFDRDLSLAGRLSCLDRNNNIVNHLIDFRKPVATIPSLAIHLDRTANENRKVNPQTDTVPILLQPGDGKSCDFKKLLITQLTHEHPGIEIGSLLGYELSFYDTQFPALTGLNNDFISSARLDNLLSCYVGMRALIDSKSNYPGLLVCNDHEEVGSNSASGARGPFLKSVLERLVKGTEPLARLVNHSLMVSSDNAHGIHPNFSDRHDGNHGPILNKGPVIKTNANQRYATTSETAACFRRICQEANVPVQDFVTRTDMACGTTIGPITAAAIGVKTVDVGVPQLAMHSIRETCGSLDPWYLYRALIYFFQKGLSNQNQ